MVCCLLFVVCSSSLAVRCSLFVAVLLLFGVCCFVVGLLLFGARCSLFVVRCSLFDSCVV